MVRELVRDQQVLARFAGFLLPVKVLKEVKDQCPKAYKVIYYDSRGRPQVHIIPRVNLYQFTEENRIFLQIPRGTWQELQDVMPRQIHQNSSSSSNVTEVRPEPGRERETQQPQPMSRVRAQEPGTSSQAQTQTAPPRPPPTASNESESTVTVLNIETNDNYDATKEMLSSFQLWYEQRDEGDFVFELHPMPGKGSGNVELKGHSLVLGGFLHPKYKKLKLLKLSHVHPQTVESFIKLAYFRPVEKTKKVLFSLWNFVRQFGSEKAMTWVLKLVDALLSSEEEVSGWTEQDFGKVAMILKGDEAWQKRVWATGMRRFKDDPEACFNLAKKMFQDEARDNGIFSSSSRDPRVKRDWIKQSPGNEHENEESVVGRRKKRIRISSSESDESIVTLSPS